MAHADTMINITQCKLEEFVGENGSSVGEAKQRVISKGSAQAHGAGVEDGLVAKTAETAMAMNNLDAFSDANVSEDGKEGEDGGKGGVAIDLEEGHVVDLDAVGEIADALAVVVGMSYDNDLVAAVDELCGELVDVRLDASRLGEEEVANHSDVVCAACHDGGG